MISRYIFTVTAGRSGQNTLSSLLENYVHNCHVAFEEPKINYIFKGKISNIERHFRRKFIETHELLGRGNVLKAMASGDIKYIESISRKKIARLNKSTHTSDFIYIDVSKYFARGLHLGFQEFLPKFSLIHLVRDPILNMKSFLNRNKDFYLDNNQPNANCNKLIMNQKHMDKCDLYLWAWFEMTLRYESMKKLDCVEFAEEIRTDQLNNSSYIDLCLDNLGLSHDKVEMNTVRLNTNINSGYDKTIVTRSDINKFEKFIEKVPNDILSQIKYLDSYNPYLVHNI
jgi:hypothetical protein